MDENEALARLHAILAQPQFQANGDVPWWQQLLAPALNFIWGLLAQLVQLAEDSASGREGWLGVGVVVLCAGVLIGALVYLARAVRLSVVGETRLRRASLAERRERSDELWQAAQRLASAGELGEALRMAYLSALYALDEHALVHVETTLTNREHAARLARQHPALGETFAALVDRYERVRYGGVAVGLETFTSFSARAAEVRAEALEQQAAIA